MYRKDLYKLLNVPKTASTEEIKTSYRKLALKHHPDMNPGKSSLESFQKISHAYNILSNPAERAKYDNEFVHQFNGYSDNIARNNRYSNIKVKNNRRIDEEHFDEKSWNFWHYGDNIESSSVRFGPKQSFQEFRSGIKYSGNGPRRKTEEEINLQNYRKFKENVSSSLRRKREERLSRQNNNRENDDSCQVS